MKSEYDLSQGARGKFYHPNAHMTLPVEVRREFESFDNMVPCPDLLDADLQAVLNGKTSLQVYSASPTETRALAARLAQLITGANAKGEIILLMGDLGSGKTTFVQGFCHAVGVAEKITSPTFTLMHVYHGTGLDIYHFDFYRLTSTAAIAGLGCEEYFEGDGISLIEWPELALPFLPGRALRLKFSMVDFVNQPEARVIEIGRA
ncbi:tRNA (adenosine(37)-N6)-threonylcarbamoyltransferase complex ATPase subunit type 1 TsaE [candidate division KSB1 bacterium]|nr:tRNA (adenosine(37)-N6)-threonylcarbamoyltransferase complex ATPase subunit type 1 TsaE [candidate division KSB1 bacterium]